MLSLIFSLLNSSVHSQTVILIDESSSDMTIGWFFFFFFTIMNKKWNNRDEYLHFPHSSMAWVTSLLTRIIVSNTGSTFPQMCYLQCNSDNQDTFLCLLCIINVFVHHFCKFRQSTKQNIKPWFVVFASFCSVNTPTVASLQLPAWSHCTWSLKSLIALCHSSPTKMQITSRARVSAN